MATSLKHALGVGNLARVAFVGSGGKTTALFLLAAEFTSPVLITATSHLEFFQTKQADRHFYFDDATQRLDRLDGKLSGVTLISGPKNNRSVAGLGVDSLLQILSIADEKRMPLLIEADGSRRHPVKAPAQHEPPIPNFVDTVVVTLGLSALGQPCNSKWIHRPEIFADLSGLQSTDDISLDALERVLCHPYGGLKNIPAHSRRVALLNQADTQELRAQARILAIRLLPIYQSVIVASLKAKNKPVETNIHDVYM